jgi:hypothetical protein
MTAATVVDAVRNRIDVAKDTAEMVGAHLRDCYCSQKIDQPGVLLRGGT